MAVPEAYTREDVLINKPQTFDEDGVPITPAGDALAIAANVGTDQEYVSGTIQVQLIDQDFAGRATAPGGLNFLPGFKHGTYEAPHFSFDGVTRVMGIAGQNYPEAFGGLNNLPADFSNPGAVTYDAYDGSIVVADTGHNRIVRVNYSSGQVSLIAGAMDGSSGYEEGAALAARFNQPSGVAVNALNGDMYVADAGNHVIRYLANTQSGFVTSRLAGSSGNAGFENGNTTDARFSSPGQLIMDDKGILYVSDTGNRAIRRVLTISGGTSTLAGAPTNPAYQDGDGVNAGFGAPAGLAFRDVGGKGYVYVADPDNNCIRQISDDPADNYAVSTLVGDPNTAGFQDGARYGPSGVPQPLFRRPTGLAYGPMVEEDTEYLWINDADNHRIRALNLDDPQLPVRTMAGTGVPGNEDAYAKSSRLNGGAALTIKPVQGYGIGGIFFIEFFNARLRLLGPEIVG
jgi:DNA-binding beta-propeller fold protein YncE